VKAWATASMMLRSSSALSNRCRVMRKSLVAVISLLSTNAACWPG
jgi:hypothetical protein